MTGCAPQRYHSSQVDRPPVSIFLVQDPIPFQQPVEGKLSLPFGAKEEGVAIKGIVLTASEGALVRAARSGKVALIDAKLKGYGKTIILEHSEDFSTVYARNSEILVRPGQEVHQGDPLGRVGRAGKGGTPQLYFEIRKKSKAEDPAQFLPKF